MDFEGTNWSHWLFFSGECAQALATANSATRDVVRGLGTPFMLAFLSVALLRWKELLCQEARWEKKEMWWMFILGKRFFLQCFICASEGKSQSIFSNAKFSLEGFRFAMEQKKQCPFVGKKQRNNFGISKKKELSLRSVFYEAKRGKCATRNFPHKNRELW